MRHFLLIRVKALLAACKPWILLDFHSFFDDTWTKGNSKEISKGDSRSFTLAFLFIIIIMAIRFIGQFYAILKTGGGDENKLIELFLSGTPDFDAAENTIQQGAHINATETNYQ